MYSLRGGQSIIVACVVCSVLLSLLWFPPMLDLRPTVPAVVAIKAITDATPLDENSVKEGFWVLVCPHVLLSCDVSTCPLREILLFSN